MLNIKGLVISERDVGESAKAVTLLTAESGCIDVLVRGGRKSKKSISATQLFCYAEYSLEEKRDAKNNIRYYYNSSEPLNIFYKIRLDAKKTALGCYFSELVRFSSESSENAKEVMRLILNALYFLDNGQREPELLRAIFELRLACETGYRPDLVGCHECYKVKDSVMYFDLRTGHLMCKNCKEKLSSISALSDDSVSESGNIYITALDPTLLYTVRFIALVEQERLFNFRLSDRYLCRLSDLTEKYLRYQFGKRFNTLKFYKML